MAATPVNMPVVSIDINMFWQIINFIILMFIFRKKLKEPLLKIIESRKATIAQEITEAEEKKKAAEIYKKEMEDELLKAKKEASNIIVAAEKKAFERGDDIVREAQQNREKIIKSAELERAKLEESLKKELTVNLRETAALMAAELVAKKLDSQAKDKLVDEFISEVGEVKW